MGARLYIGTIGLPSAEIESECTKPELNQNWVRQD